MPAQVYYGEWRGQEVAVKVLALQANHRNTVADEVKALKGIAGSMAIICALGRFLDYKSCALVLHANAAKTCLAIERLVA